jgi:DNA-binding MarR family transcriptional regulator
MVIDDEVARLRRVVTRLSRHFNAVVRTAGLSPAQASILGTLVRRGPRRVSGLAEAEGINPTMVSRLVSRLDADGLLRRGIDADDRRAVLVEATEAGRALYARIVRERTGLLEANLAKLPPGQRDLLSAALPALEALTGDWIDKPADRP